MSAELEVYKKIIRGVGKPPKFPDFPTLRDAVVSYFEWADANPLKVSTKTKASKKQGTKSTEAQRSEDNETVPRPLSLSFMLLHIGYYNDWSHFKRVYEPKGEEYRRLIIACEDIVKGQQIDGALAGYYKENLVARLNGIKEQVETTENKEQVVKGYNVTQALKNIYGEGGSDGE